MASLSCFQRRNLAVNFAQFVFKVLVAAGVSAAIGQLAKPFASVIIYGRDFNFRTAFEAGGFPSTHSSVSRPICSVIFNSFVNVITIITAVFVKMFQAVVAAATILGAER